MGAGVDRHHAAVTVEPAPTSVPGRDHPGTPDGGRAAARCDVLRDDGAGFRGHAPPPRSGRAVGCRCLCLFGHRRTAPATTAIAMAASRPTDYARRGRPDWAGPSKCPCPCPWPRSGLRSRGRTVRGSSNSSPHRTRLARTSVSVGGGEQGGSSPPPVPRRPGGRGQDEALTGTRGANRSIYLYRSNPAVLGGRFFVSCQRVTKRCGPPARDRARTTCGAAVTACSSTGSCRTARSPPRGHAPTAA